MMHLIPVKDHYTAHHAWLTSSHHFSFAEYQDPLNEQWGVLRVFNEDFISPASGFPLHPHDNMEIITYVLSRELRHEDSMGNKGIVSAGEVQVMSAGTGVWHAEFNGSKEKGLHLLQMWVFPEKKKLVPSYDQRSFSRDEKTNRLACLVSPDKKDGGMMIHQKAKLFASVLHAGKTVSFSPTHERQYLFVIDGRMKANGRMLNTQDAARIEKETVITFSAEQNTHFIVWDVAAE